MSKLRTSVLSASHQLDTLSSKSSKKRQKNHVYLRNGRYYTRWTNVPAKIIAEFQATKECPKTIYRDMRYCTIQEPEKLTHAHAVKLIRRYKEALPDDPGLLVAKSFFMARLEELRKLELKDTYTRATLLRHMATCMSETDAHLIRSYLDANAKSVPMRELANSVIKNRMQNLIRQSSAKPADQMLPLNHTNRQHMLLHKLAVEEKPLPNVFKAQKSQKRPNSSNKKSESPFKKSKGGNQRSFSNNQATKPSTKTFSGAPRPPKNGGQVNQKSQQASRGAQNPTPKPNGQCKSLLTPEAAVANMQKAYDFTKIADKLQHFGSCTPEVQLMLHHQLDQRGIKVAKKEDQ